MMCQNCRSAIATRRYGYGRGVVRNIAPLCDRCAETLTGLGMDLRAERVAPVTDTRPRWLRNLRAKDFTGSIA